MKILRKKTMNSGSFTILAMLLAAWCHGQQPLTLDDALKRVQEEHPLVKASVSQQQQLESLKRGAIVIPKTSLVLTHGQYNSIIKTDNNITVEQTLPFPTTWSAERKLYGARQESVQWQAQEVRNNLRRQVKELYQRYYYHQAYLATLQVRDSLYATLAHAAGTSYGTGEIPLIEKTAIETQYAEINNLMQQHAGILSRVATQLQQLLALRRAG
ncbi:MAG: TolC family protein, partial [Bacteroidia bacterium]|nr:TolC family protein [Bacteroidia bacterium]